MLFKTWVSGRAKLVRITYNAKQPFTALVTVTDEAADVVVAEFWTRSDDGAITVGDVNVEMRVAAPVSLAVTNAEWEYVLTPGTYRTIDGVRRTRVDVAIAALGDPLAMAVAPHGLIG